MTVSDGFAFMMGKVLADLVIGAAFIAATIIVLFAIVMLARIKR